MVNFLELQAYRRPMSAWTLIILPLAAFTVFALAGVAA